MAIFYPEAKSAIYFQDAKSGSNKLIFTVSKASMVNQKMIGISFFNFGPIGFNFFDIKSLRDAPIKK